MNNTSPRLTLVSDQKHSFSDHIRARKALVKAACEWVDHIDSAGERPQAGPALTLAKMVDEFRGVNT